MPTKKTETSIDVNGKPLNLYIATPAGGKGPGILVLPAWWGLNPFVKQVCDQLAEHGYTALAPDYYGGRYARTIDEAETLQSEAEGDQEAMAALIKAAENHLMSLHPGQPIGILGLSMGTGWGLLTAAKDPDVAALVLFYGGWSPDFSQMRSRVLGHFAEHDPYTPFEEAQEMERNLKAAGVDVTIHLYPGTAHWFVETDRPEYNPAAAQLAWERTYEFLKQNLK